MRRATVASHRFGRGDEQGGRAVLLGLEPSATSIVPIRFAREYRAR
jgi:hypothetical protein